jgi:predicted flap endonuclease-1-like 5' DNA nuclease
MDQPNEDVSRLPTSGGVPGPGAQAAPKDVAALQRELEKWRERVPPLLAALRERSEDVERLKSELAAVRNGRMPLGQHGNPAVSEVDGAVGALASASAREEVIAELARELESARAAHAAAEGELHARSLSIDVLKRDLQLWKDKWQALARRLDGVGLPDGVGGRADDGRIAELTAAKVRLTGELAAARLALAELTEERDALQARNADLFETTGYANRQMEVLADDLAELRGTLKTLRAEHAAAVGERDQRGRECARLEGLLHAGRAEIETLERFLETLQAPARAAAADGAAQAATARIAELEAEISAQAARFDAERATLASERERLLARGHELETALGAAVEGRETAERARSEAERRHTEIESAYTAAEAARHVAEQACRAAEEGRSRAEAALRGAQAALERVELQAGGHAARLRQLEHQLEERSALVRSLEQELIDRDERLARTEAARLELEEAEVRASRHAREHAEHIQQLDGRLERQKELLLSLEAELAAAQEQVAARTRQNDTELAARDGEIRSLRLQVAALQSMLQARPAAAGSGVDADSRAGRAAEPGVGDAVRLERDHRTLRVLNQQLKDARTRNETLLERVRELESHALVSGTTASDDDLTRIRGVGPRLAQHLRELGVRSYQQIAELDPEQLEDPTHVLAPLKSRILRDRWIEQAANLFRH